MKYNVRLVIQLPFDIQNVEASSSKQAVKEVTDIIIKQTLPLMVSHNYKQVQNHMSIKLVDVNEV